MNVTYGTLPEKEQIPQPAGQAPYCAIGRMRMTDGMGNWWVGTGSLIRPAYVLTAAHVLAGKAAGTISFGYDINDVAGSTNRTVNIARAAVPTAYPGTPGWDIGVARLAGNYNGTFGFLFDLHGQGNDRAQALDTVKAKKYMTIAGYPGAGPVTPSEHPQVPLGHQYGKVGPVSDCDFSTNKIQYAFDTRGGESGSPLFVIPMSGRVQQIGVHTNWTVAHDKQVGQGTLLTDTVLAWVEHAINQLETVPSAFFVRVV